MPNTRRTTFSLDLVTYDQLRAVQAQVRAALGTHMSMSRIITASVALYHDRLVAAGQAVDGG